MAVLLATVAAEDPAEPATTPELSIFSLGNRPAGFTYHETLDMDMISSLTIMGQSNEMKMNMQVESDTTVQDLPEGGQSIHAVTEHILVSSEMAGFQFQCDTDIPQNQADGLCDPFYELVGTDLDFVVDDRGQLAEAPEGVHDSASKQVQATARLLEFIPDEHPVRVGESWYTSKSVAGLGYFEGTSDFHGWEEHEDGSKCAIISTTGTLDIDMKELYQTMGDQLAGVGDKFTITDALMSAKVCWDDDSKMAVWGETDLQFTMHMDNPMDSTETLDMPVHEVMKTTCAIKQ